MRTWHTRLARSRAQCHRCASTTQACRHFSRNQNTSPPILKHQERPIPNIGLSRQARALSHQTQWPHSALLFDNIRDGAHPGFQRQLIHNDASKSSLPTRPPQDAITDAQAWTQLLQPLLPADQTDSTIAGQSSSRKLSEIILQARLSADIDVLYHVGVHEKKWNVMFWIVNHLLESMPIPNLWEETIKASSSIQWPQSLKLDDCVSEKVRVSPPGFIADTSDQSTPSLNELADGLPGKIYLDDVQQARDALGQIWRTLGSLILAATNHRPEEAQVIMQYVQLILAKLHRHGFVPRDLHHTSINPDPAALQQPILLNELSSQILCALTDAEFESQFSQGSEFDGTVNNQGIVLWKHTIRGQSLTDSLTPELWMEFVLWCCVHGGWVKEGAAILADMKSIQGSSRWSLICWRDIMQNPDKRWHEFEQTRLQETVDQERGGWFWNRSKSDSKGQIIRRTISTEVVIATIEGLVNSITTRGGRRHGYSFTEVFDSVTQLKSFLSREQMNLGVMSWDNIISRIADLPESVAESNPKFLSLLLKLTEPYGREIKSKNSVSRDEGAANPLTYVFDGTASILGLYHRAIKACVQSRDARGASDLIANLQTVTDQNKRNSIDEFFEQLKRNEQKSKTTAADQDMQSEGALDFADRYSGIEYPAFYPHMPISLLADLLELSTVTENYELGRWMVHSEDIDGPVISKDMYKNPIISPALIRFAASAQDEELLSAVVDSQTSQVTGPTVLALCQQQLRKGDWMQGMTLLKVLRDQLHYEWSVADIARLMQALILHRAPDADPDKIEFAGELMSTILAGGLGLKLGPRAFQLQTLIGVLCSASPELAEVCSGALIKGKRHTSGLSEEAFNILLEGIMQTYGSGVGQRLWHEWTQKSGGIVLKTQLDSTSTNGGVSVEAETSETVFAARINPRLSTLRLIIQRALSEAKQQAQDEAEGFRDGRLLPRHAVLDWAVQMLRLRHGMRDEAVSYETQGYVSAQPAATTTDEKSPYGSLTLRMWQALREVRGQWAAQHEEILRRFAASANKKQMTFEALPAAERCFLQELANDFGLGSESFGEAEERALTVLKTRSRSVRVPARRVGEVAKSRSKEETLVRKMWTWHGTHRETAQADHSESTDGRETTD